MDNIYKKGKIYTIRCLYDDSLIYVGSTTEKYLSRRMSKHRYNNNTTILSKYINDDWENWYIELYQDYPCDNKQQLEKREGEVIREIGSINKRIEGRTQKQRYDDNRNEILKYNKGYYKDNHDKILNYQEQYRKNNKQKISCDKCGCMISKLNMSRHKQSIKCLNYNVINK